MSDAPKKDEASKKDEAKDGHGHGSEKSSMPAWAWVLIIIALYFIGFFNWLLNFASNFMMNVRIYRSEIFVLVGIAAIIIGLKRWGKK
jgi:hypothetical protein